MNHDGSSYESDIQSEEQIGEDDETTGNVESHGITESPVPEEGAPVNEMNSLIEHQLVKIMSNSTIKTDHAKPQEIPFTEEMKDKLAKSIKEGLELARKSGEETLQAILDRGRFLKQVSVELKSKKWRIFRAFCAWCGWSKSSAYNWMKLYGAYGEHLTDYAMISERKLTALASHPRAMDIIDNNLDEIESRDETSLREWLSEKHPQPSRRVRGTTKVLVGRFSIIRRKDKGYITGLTNSDHDRLMDFLKRVSDEETADVGEVSNALDTSDLETKEVQGETVKALVPDPIEVDHSAPETNAALPAYQAPSMIGTLNLPAI